MIAASVFHQQGFKKVVGYRKSVGTDIPIGMVGEDGAAYYMNGVVLCGHPTHQILYLVPHTVVHHIVLRTDVGEIVALFYRLFRPFHILSTSHVPTNPTGFAVVI